MASDGLVRVFAGEISRMVQRQLRTGRGGAFVNLMLNEACKRHGVEMQVVRGVCTVPSDKWFDEWSEPHVWLVDGEGHITDLEGGFWWPYFVALYNVWFDGEEVMNKLSMMFAEPEAAFSAYEYITDLHTQEFPFKIPMLLGEPRAPPVEGVNFYRWHYATGEEAAAMLHPEARPETHENLERFNTALAAMVDNPQVLYSGSAGAEVLWLEMEKVLDDAAEKYKAGSS